MYETINPCSLVLIFCFQTVLAFLNIEELGSVNYAVDILNKPVLSGQLASGSVMYLKSKFGQEYQCSLPELAKSEDRSSDELPSNEMDISELLKPLQTSPCLIKTKDWWTYEFCYGKYIKQYHIEDNKIVGGEILLGYYDSEFDWNNNSHNENNRNRVQRYHSQYYVNGTRCDITGNSRRTEVRFLCEEGSNDLIARVDEPESCRYVVTIHTSHVCNHPFLQPPPTYKPQPVTCSPVLTAEQYEEYLLDKEEEKKLNEERRRKWLAEQEEHLEQLKKKKMESNKEDEDEQNNDVEVTAEDKVEVTSMKQSLRNSLQEQFNSLLSEAEEELGQDLLDDDREIAFNQLAATLNKLLEKLDRAEQDISHASRTLERVQQVMDAQGSTGNHNGETTEAKGQSTRGISRRMNVLQERNVDQNQREHLEQAVRQKLEQSGLDTSGRKIEVKIITAEYYDTEDDDGTDENDDDHDKRKYQVLSDEESKQFQNLIITFLTGNREAAQHMEEQRRLEENYQFVWDREHRAARNEENE